MPASWDAPGSWSNMLEARRTVSLAELPGNLWFRMTAPDGTQRRIHSALVERKLTRGWTLAGEFTQRDDGEFPT